MNKKCKKREKTKGYSYLMLYFIKVEVIKKSVMDWVGNEGGFSMNRKKHKNGMRIECLKRRNSAAGMSVSSKNNT